jgi:hypothetical protein
MFNRSYFPIAAAVLMLMASSGLSPAQETAQAPVKSEAREAWRKSMVKTDLPGKGCFTASYPDTAWHEIPCSTAKPYPPQPRQVGGSGGSAPIVGGTPTDDWSAGTSGLYTFAEGTFNSVTPGISEASGAPPRDQRSYSQLLFPADQLEYFHQQCHHAALFGRREPVDVPGMGAVRIPKQPSTFLLHSLRVGLVLAGPLWRTKLPNRMDTRRG